jgi:hypothetical protein
MVAQGGGLDLRAVDRGAALFDDGVELADGLVYVGVGAAEAARSCGCGVGATAGGRGQAREHTGWCVRPRCACAS